MTTTIICGSRSWTDAPTIEATLTTLLEEGDVVYHGACEGADLIAAKIATDLGLTVHARPADWDTYGKSAGPRRNSAMLEEAKPTLVIAFLGWGRSDGTRNMVELALSSGVKTVLIVRPREER